MPGISPIRLGSAMGNTWTFESGSSVTTSDSGIQSCDVRALFPSGETVFSNLPAAGTSFTTLFGHTYLPTTFLLDYTEGGPQVEFTEAKVARVSFKFKRPDPLHSGPTQSRQVYVDSIINYDTGFLTTTLTVIGFVPGANVSTASLTGPASPFGFPEPVVTVKYNTTTQPGIGSGDLSFLYAIPGSAKAAGFPPAPDISIPVTDPIPAGATIAYFNGTTTTTVTLTVDTTFVFNYIFKANSRGWQLTKLKYDPLSAANFYDVEETWRNFYTPFGAQFVSRTPP